MNAWLSTGNAGTFEPGTLAEPAPPGPETVGLQTPEPPPVGWPASGMTGLPASGFGDEPATVNVADSGLHGARRQGHRLGDRVIAGAEGRRVQGLGDRHAVAADVVVGGRGFDVCVAVPDIAGLSSQ